MHTVQGVEKPWDPTIRRECRDCEAKEGQFHAMGCLREKCPWCFGQLVMCGCLSEHCILVVGEDYDDQEFGEYTDEQVLTRQMALCKKGRIPFVLNPMVCIRCGEVWPEKIANWCSGDKEWNDIIPADLRQGLLCGPCFTLIKEWVLDARRTAEKPRATYPWTP